MKQKQIIARFSMVLFFLMIWFGMGYAAFAKTFSDVSDRHWAKHYIDEGVKARITNGFPDGTFKPQNWVTTAEFATFLIRGYGEAEDIQVGNQQSYPKGTTDYMRKMNFSYADRPNMTINRGQVAQLVASSQGYHFNETTAIKYLLVEGLSEGKTAATVEGYGSSDALTRSEALAFIMRLREKGLVHIEKAPLSFSDSTAVDLAYNKMIGRLTEERKEENVEQVETIESSTEQETSDSKKQEVVQKSDFEYEVFLLVNEEREEYGLPSFVFHEELSDVARQKSQDMIDNGYFAHQSPTYGSPFEMMRQFEIEYRSHAGENIAAGQPTPAVVVDAWMNSPGHRANILSSDYTHLGVGFAEGGSYGTYWTQMFIDDYVDYSTAENSSDNENVTVIPDPNLDKAIRETLNKPSGGLTKEDLLALTKLEATSYDIADLTGLEHATNLTEIWLLKNQVSDLSPLRDLTNLTRLYFSHNEISDLSPISNLNNLKWLTINGNQITDISILKDIATLQEVVLYENPIEDESIIDELKESGVQVFY